ncbi:hypothetical protein G4B88_009016, partial [Cannabis sativa]
LRLHMMKMEVNIVSEEMIKPNNPTPNHPTTYQLSFLDQLSPAVYTNCVMFYNNINIIGGVEILLHNLKTSLSHALTLFYPLAGRLKKNASCIECNDMGVPFIEAKLLNCNLSEFLSQNPIDPIQLNNLIPFETDHGVSEILLGIQINIFSCGSIAIGSSISHIIADGLSFFMFLNKWAAISRGDASFACLPPQFEAASLFPPKNISGFNPRVDVENKNNFISKRFVFNASTIQNLKQKYVNISNVSRVEALSTFIWNRFVAVTQLQVDYSKTSYAMVQLVNLRTRFEPSLSESSFGNLYRFVIIKAVGSEKNDDQIIKQMREELSHIDDKYIKNLQEGTQHLEFMKKSGKGLLKRETTVALSVSSWCRFPLYESDFGWGKPTWVGLAPLWCNNVVTFLDTKSGDGIEAYISLSRNDMANLETDKEFLAFVASLVLHLGMDKSAFS